MRYFSQSHIDGCLQLNKLFQASFLKAQSRELILSFFAVLDKNFATSVMEPEKLSPSALSLIPSPAVYEL